MMPQPDTHRKEDEMSDPVTAHDTISTAQLAATVELACRAPSLHNSQPWRWIFQNGTLQAGKWDQNEPTDQQPAEQGGGYPHQQG